MKKVLLGFISLILAGQVAVAQPVSDNAVIPMAITLNTILRLNVVSGGNIEFVFNSLSDYTNGLSGAAYATSLTVSSSTNWDLNIYSATANFNADDGAGTIPVSYVTYNITDGGGANTVGFNPVGDQTLYYVNNGGLALATAMTDLSDLSNTSLAILQNNDSGTPEDNYGNGAANVFSINWQCGTLTAAGGANAITGAGQLSGRYATNIVLSLSAQ